MKIIALDGKQMTTIQSCHEHLAAQLQLPSYYGKNLDALWDIVSTISEDTHITLSSSVTMLNALDTYRPFFTELHNGHNVEAIPASYIDEVKEGIKVILATNGAGDEDFEVMNSVCKRHMLREDAWILYQPTNL